MSGFLGKKITKQKIVHILHFSWAAGRSWALSNMVYIYTPKPLYGVGFKATQQGLGRGPREGIGLGWCLERDISTEGVNLGAALCMGTLVWLWGWLLSKQPDIYLVFLGNSCKLRNLEGAASERGECQVLLDMGNGAMSAGYPLAQLFVFGFSSISQSLLLPTLSFAYLSLLACYCSNCLQLLCDLWQILSVSRPQTSFAVFKSL